MNQVDVRRDFGAMGDGIADDFPKLQAALDSVRNGGTVLFPAGTYLISDCLIFYSEQTLRFEEGAVLLRKKQNRETEPKELRYMLASYTEKNEAYAGYGGTHDVLIEGGVFDANAELRENQKITIVNTAHCKNITVRGCTFLHCAEWHCIEYNSTCDAVIEDCVFDGPSYTGFREVNELVQLDAAFDGCYGPVFFPDGSEMALLMDGTPCKNITIRNNRFLCDGFAAIGNHGAGAHTGICISGNRFEGDPGKRGYVAFRPEVCDVTETENTVICSRRTEITDLPDRAVTFALAAHHGQKRKNGVPYILHPLEVAAVVASMTADPEIISAAVLHDTVEDTDVTPGIIRAYFGDRVYDLVMHETENKREELSPKETWRIRKEESLAALAESEDPAVKMMWLGDKLSNLRALHRQFLQDGDKIFRIFNNTDPKAHAWYYETILELLKDLREYPAYGEYRRLYHEIFDRYLERKEKQDV